MPQLLIPIPNVQKNNLKSWNPFFHNEFAGFSQLEDFWSPLAASLSQWPQLGDYNAWAKLAPSCPVEFILQQSGFSYEPQIYLYRQVQTRLESWHDFFNNLTWILFPKTKWAMISLSMAENARKAQPSRTSLQNQLAHFDECGMILCYADPRYPELVRHHEWKRLFCNPKLTTDCEVYILGHGLFEKGLEPYIGMTGKILFLPVERDFMQLPMAEKYLWLDEVLAEHLLKRSQLALSPFPLLGWPGWHVENEREDFYENTNYFRGISKVLRSD